MRPAPTTLRSTVLAAALALVSLLAPGARADYAVFTTGMRMHISGYEKSGSNLRLHVEGGTVDVPAASVARFEPEDIFAPVIVPAPTAAAFTGPFSELISAAAKKYSFDPQFLARVIQAESNFNPRAISNRNAQGLMQLLPSTSKLMSVHNPFDPAQSIEGGTHYLRQLLDKFSGNVELALAAYNAGPDRVVAYHGVPPYRETRNYVRKITKPAPQKPAGTSPKAPQTQIPRTISNE